MTNEELLKKTKINQVIINKIKNQQLKFFEHIIREKTLSGTCVVEK